MVPAAAAEESAETEAAGAAARELLGPSPDRVLMPSSSDSDDRLGVMGGRLFYRIEPAQSPLKEPDGSTSPNSKPSGYVDSEGKFIEDKPSHVLDVEWEVGP